MPSFSSTRSLIRETFAQKYTCQWLGLLSSSVCVAVVIVIMQGSPSMMPLLCSLIPHRAWKQSDDGKIKSRPGEREHGCEPCSPLLCPTRSPCLSTSVLCVAKICHVSHTFSVATFPAIDLLRQQSTRLGKDARCEKRCAYLINMFAYGPTDGGKRDIERR